MNIPFKVVFSIKDMESAIESMKDCDTILVDTTGRSSKNIMQISELRAFIEKINTKDIHLVISGETKNRDITDEYMAISIPVKGGSYLPLKKGEIIEGIHYENKAVYKFFTSVIGRKIDRIMMIILKKPEKFVKIQRRNYVRVYPYFLLLHLLPNGYLLYLFFL